MKQALVLMVGIPAAGKSSWIKNDLSKHQFGSIVVSRDEIRKAFVGENATEHNYFSREDEVFEAFINAINDEVARGTRRIYVDATHLNPKSRAKVLRNIRNRETLKLEVVCLECEVSIAQMRNMKRTGFARIPNSAITNMAKIFQKPAYDEFKKFGFKKVELLRG